MLNDAPGPSEARLREIVGRATFERNVLGDINEIDLLETRTLYAAAYALIRVGNTVTQYSRALEQDYPEYQWVYWVNLRNELAHELGNVDVRRVWQAIVVSIPELIRTISGEPSAP